MSIINIIKELVRQSSLNPAVEGLLKVSTSQKEYNRAIEVSARFNRIKEEQSGGGESYETITQDKNKITRSLINYIDSLPSSIDILHRKLKLIIDSEFIANEEIISLLHQILKIGHHNEISRLELNLDFSSDYLYQDGASNPIDTDKWIEISKNIRSELNDYIKDISAEKLTPNWEKIFFDYCVNSKESYGTYKKTNEKATVEAGYSKYFEDIKKERDETTRRKLLLWQEEFLIGNYEEAIKYIDDVRLNSNVDSSQAYEYLMLTYCNQKIDEAIRKYVTTENKNLLNKLFLYIERTQKLGNLSTTKAESLRLAYQQILSSIRKFYRNISFDYVLNPAQRGVSKKRELIKNCITLSILFFNEIIEEEYTDYHVLYEELIVEILGGSKYLWLEIINNSPVNTVTFDALEKYEELRGIVNRFIENKNKFNVKNDIDVQRDLYQELVKKHKGLEKVNNVEKAKASLIKSCRVAFYIFKDKDFKFLETNIRNSKLSVINLNETRFKNDIVLKKSQIEPIKIKRIPQSFNDSERGIDAFTLMIESITVHFKFFHQCFFEGKS